MRTAWICLLAAGFVLALPSAAAAQAPAPQPAATAPSQPLLKSEELDQLLAPIALYSDTLLSEVLMASTYPLEVVQADRWVRSNKGLTGDKLKTALEQQSWDTSVKSLVAVPTVLNMMSDKLDWTQKLGDAVLAQEKDVMDAIQRLRGRAQAADKLKTTKEQKVTTRTEDSKQVIAIEQTAPETVYVPYYNPAVAYGDWPYPDYPPLYFAPPPGFVGGAVLATGIAFGAGFVVSRAIAWNYWNGGLRWGNNRIVNVNRTNISNIRVTNWQHDPAHRHGVQYRNAAVRDRYGKAAVGAGDRRLDFRGHGGEQVLRPGSDRPGASTGIGERRPAGDRPARAAKGSPKAGTARVAHRDTAFSNPGKGAATRTHADRGRASVASHRASVRPANVGRIPHAGPRAGGGGFRGGGGRRR